MSDTSENIVKTESKVKPRNKKGFREPTSLHVDPKLWQEVRIMSVLKNVSVTEYFERALRKQIDEDNREAGRQGYQVGHGGMYIPPPPMPSQQQQQPQQPQESTVDPYPNPEYQPILLNIYMPKTKYPTTKNEILELPGWKLAQRIEEFLHNELGYNTKQKI